MGFSVHEEEVDGVTVVRPAGRLTLGDSNGALKNAIASLVQAGRVRLVLNLEAVPYVDSSGLGEIASAHVTVSRTGGQLLLAAVPERVMEALKITRLTHVVASTPDERSAVAKLQGGP